MTVFYDFHFSQIRHQLPTLFCTALHIFYCINLNPSQSMDPISVGPFNIQSARPLLQNLKDTLNMLKNEISGQMGEQRGFLVESPSNMCM